MDTQSYSNYGTQVQAFEQQVQQIQNQLEQNKQPVPQNIRNLQTELASFQKWCSANTTLIQEALTQQSGQGHAAGSGRSNT